MENESKIVSYGNLLPWRLMSDLWPWRNHRAAATMQHIMMVSINAANNAEVLQYALATLETQYSISHSA